MLSERVQDPTAIFMAMNDIRGKEMRLSFLRGNDMEELKTALIAELSKLSEEEIDEIIQYVKTKYNL